jgi:hypothetical protein
MTDDLVGERGERELGVGHVLLGDARLPPVLHHRLEQPEHAALEDVGSRQVARVAELEDQRQDVGAHPVHRLRHRHQALPEPIPEGLGS